MTVHNAKTDGEICFYTIPIFQYRFPNSNSSTTKYVVVVVVVRVRVRQSKQPSETTLLNENVS